VTKTKPDKFSPHVVENGDDYIRVEYESPIFGVAPCCSTSSIMFRLCSYSVMTVHSSVQFVDDVEFWFPPGKKSIVQYRSASRSGLKDFGTNKKRVQASAHLSYLTVYILTNSVPYFMV
jgi:uncharacterized protein (DUF1499 family)